MDIAKHEILDGCNHGTLILAESQMAGRGREPGRKWDSSHAKNLLFTVVIQADQDPIRLVLAAPLAICKAIRREDINAWIKWPNDVWINDKKVSGLLIDSVTQGQDNVCSLGIGINVNQPFAPNFQIPDSDNKRCSIHDITGRKHCREFILAGVLNELENLLTKKRSDIIEEYQIYDGLLGQSLIVMPLKVENPLRWQAVGKSFDETGYLQVVRKDNQKIETLINAEVSIRPEKIKSQYTTELIVHDIPKLLTGTYKNQLNSTMTLIAEPSGYLHGSYLTIVGNAPRKNPVHGSWVNGVGGTVLSFTVAWNRDIPSIPFKSTTSWSGLFNEKELTIVTTWLLTSVTDQPESWDSTHTNKDVFKKITDQISKSNI